MKEANDCVLYSNSFSPKNDPKKTLDSFLTSPKSSLGAHHIADHNNTMNSFNAQMSPPGCWVGGGYKKALPIGGDLEETTRP
jgi:hypothetical protein